MAIEKQKDQNKEEQPVEETETRGLRKNEEPEQAEHPDAMNQVPAEPDPSVAHPQPNDGMDSVLVDPNQVEDRGTEHRS